VRADVALFNIGLFLFACDIIALFSWRDRVYYERMSELQHKRFLKNLEDVSREMRIESLTEGCPKGKDRA